jgi:hypothetical protein
MALRHIVRPFAGALFRGSPIWTPNLACDASHAVIRPR